MAKFNICLVWPTGYIHSLALFEIAEYFYYELQSLGHNVTFYKNRFDSESTNLVLGAHLLADPQVVPAHSIIFNTEQWGESNPWSTNHIYRSIIKEHVIWDYSVENLAAMPTSRSCLVGLYYCSQLARIPPAHKTHDLIFYGSINTQRQELLDQLASCGLSILSLSNLYSAERDHYLAAARAVLNLHYYPTQILQQPRIFYPLINGIPVISEDFCTHSTPERFCSTLFYPAGNSFVTYVQSLFDDLPLFSDLTARKLSSFERSSGLADLSKAIDASFASFNSSPPLRQSSCAPSRRINLGSGRDYRAGYINVDIDNSSEPDLLLDFSQPLQLPFDVTLRSGYKLALAEFGFDEIIAINVLQHVQNLRSLMTNCLRLLAHGGKLEVVVPYDLSLGAWQDPGHLRAFNENSWLYYTDWAWDLGWFDSRFELTKITYSYSHIGRQLLESGFSESALLASPRAIDSMHTVLVKRATSPSERTLWRSYMPASDLSAFVPAPSSGPSVQWRF